MCATAPDAGTTLSAVGRSLPQLPRVSASLGAVLLQAVASVSTLVQMFLFGILLPRDAFDDYAVWITASAFCVGLGQAIGVERVMVGKRTLADGMASARVLALAIAAIEIGFAVWLHSIPLLLCSITSLVYVLWDYLRFGTPAADATTFYLRDLLVLGVQLAAVALTAFAGLERTWLPAVWWASGSVLWTAFVLQQVRTSWALRARDVLWSDRRESVPLLFDAAMAGVPLVVALALARSATSGAAADARMALTLLGPITVLGLAIRRLLYSRAASGRLDRRGLQIFFGGVVVVFVSCTTILAMTRTPIYSAVLPAFGALTWAAILGFAINHTSLMAVIPPAGYLRAESRSRAVGWARFLATLVGLGMAVALHPLGTPAQVAWPVASASIAYCTFCWLFLWLPLGRDRSTPATPTPVATPSS